MDAVVRLLGVPSVETDGTPAPAPRARKSWALLAYLLLTDQPPSRQRLSVLLFPDAADPLGALRWSLADLRRSLAPYAEIGGDPVTVLLGPGVRTDVGMVLSGVVDGSTSLTEDLLENLSLDACPAFETWLQVERYRLASACEALLREDALHCLGSGRPEAAVAVATELVIRNPLDEANQVLLVRSLAATGAHAAALWQAERCEQLFRAELGTTPSPALRAAADNGSRPSVQHSTRGSAAATAQLEAGQAAVNAGAVDAGLLCLRRAVSEAGAAHDGGLRLRALVALGSALVHGVRGRDEEGAAVLHEALVTSEATGDAHAAARVMRELGFIDVQAGRRQRADRWLDRAESSVGDDDLELSAILGNKGMNQSDMGHYADALDTLTRSVDRALASGSKRQAAWSASLIGRVHVLRQDHDRAVASLEHSIDLVQETSWIAFAPWPQSLRAEVDRLDGQHDRATDAYARAFALACQLEDPCWEGIAARGTGLLLAEVGDLTAAVSCLREAHDRCTRWPDTYRWIDAYILDATCQLAVSGGHPDAVPRVEQLAALASRGGMHEFVVRSHVHRAHLGQDGAASAAAHAAALVDNPALHSLVSTLVPRGEGAAHVAS